MLVNWEQIDELINQLGLIHPYVSEHENGGYILGQKEEYYEVVKFLKEPIRKSKYGAGYTYNYILCPTEEIKIINSQEEFIKILKEYL